MSGVGGVGALLGAGWARDQATRLLSSEWLSELDASSQRFSGAILKAIQGKVQILEEKRAQVPDTNPEVNDWIDARFSDDIISLKEVAYDLEALIPNLSQPARARACLSAMNAGKIHPFAIEDELTELIEVLGSEPSRTQSAGKKLSEAWSTLKSKLPKTPE